MLGSPDCNYFEKLKAMSILDFHDAQVLVLGDVMLDRYWRGDAKRISPESPVPIVKISDCQDRPGGAANVAMNIASLGGAVNLLGLVGQDEYAGNLRNLLETAQVKTTLIETADCPTITKLRVLGQNQQMIRLDFEETFSKQAQESLLSQYELLLKENKAVVLSDYGKGTLSDQQPFIQRAKRLKVPVLIDPKGHKFSLYRGATLLTPNRKEFELVMGVCETEAALYAKAKEALAMYDLQALLITRSYAGMTLFQKDKAPLHLPAHAKEVFDVTGAGDTVIALIAAALTVGESLEQATCYANLAASLVVSKMGTSTVTATELHFELSRLQGGVRGVVDSSMILQLVADAKAKNQKIVMTNGCFDILHVGHAHYLKQAKMLGDRLIIAVNTDESVKQLKGSARPINSLKERMAMLAALECVDWVFPFSESTPLRWIEQITPDILVKGSDYAINEIAGSDHVIKSGGTVELIDFVQGFSTTKTLEKIKRAEKVEKMAGDLA